MARTIERLAAFPGAPGGSRQVTGPLYERRLPDTEATPCWSGTMADELSLEPPAGKPPRSSSRTTELPTPGSAPWRMRDRARVPVHRGLPPAPRFPAPPPLTAVPDAVGYLLPDPVSRSRTQSTIAIALRFCLVLSNLSVCQEAGLGSESAGYKFGNQRSCASMGKASRSGARWPGEFKRFLRNSSATTCRARRGLGQSRSLSAARCELVLHIAAPAASGYSRSLRAERDRYRAVAFRDPR